MTKEIEVRFLEINKESLVQKLYELHAKELGETMLEEIIFYDHALKWRDKHRFVRLRKCGDTVRLTYKENHGHTIDSAREVELEVSNMQKAKLLLERIGLIAYRHQEKRRHSFLLDDVAVDIDTWPKIPTYVEIEGSQEKSLKDAAQKLGLKWKEAVFDDARAIIEKKYSIPVSSMRWFTFEKCE